mmetsp:Transcript_955/g.2730  ORF Transcript_955/g.2730 Transcript_955/m.2730 type:complete len:332 (+) Transcript_955:683-1678(+)
MDRETLTGLVEANVGKNTDNTCWRRRLPPSAAAMSSSSSSSSLSFSQARNALNRDAPTRASWVSASSTDNGLPAKSNFAAPSAATARKGAAVPSSNNLAREVAKSDSSGAHFAHPKANAASPSAQTARPRTSKPSRLLSAKRQRCGAMRFESFASPKSILLPRAKTANSLSSASGEIEHRGTSASSPSQISSRKRSCAADLGGAKHLGSANNWAATAKARRVSPRFRALSTAACSDAPSSVKPAPRPRATAKHLAAGAARHSAKGFCVRTKSPSIASATLTFPASSIALWSTSNRAQSNTCAATKVLANDKSSSSSEFSDSPSFSLCFISS